MKMLFSSSDSSQIDLLKRKLVDAGIPCETRLEDGAGTTPELPCYPALWVRDEKNYSVALMLFASWYRQQTVPRCY